MRGSPGRERSSRTPKAEGNAADQGKGATSTQRERLLSRVKREGVQHTLKMKQYADLM